ncbi:putative b mating type locus [Melampsora americana]|nr:putative b mating type locus [Melampsora americana]
MLAEIWQSCFNQASSLIATLGSAGSKEPTAAQSLDIYFDALVLPEPPNVRTLFTHVPIDIATHCEAFFDEFIHQLSEDVKTRYQDAITKMGIQAAPHPSVQIGYVKALRSGLILYYNIGVEQALLGLKSQLSKLGLQTRIRHSSPAVSSPPGSHSSEAAQTRRGRPFIFSKEQTAVLRALLVHDDQFSSEEKELIAQTLNLTRAQVNRWFCNARARGGRKKPYEKPIPRAQRQNLGKYVSDVCQKQRSASSSSSSGSSTCSQYPSSDDDVDMWPSNALQQNSNSDDSPYLTTEPDLTENIIPMAQLYSQISSACDDPSPTNPTIEMDTSLPSSNFSFSQSTSSLNEFLLPNDLSSLFDDPDPFNLNTLSDDGFLQSLSYSSTPSAPSWNFS